MEQLCNSIAQMPESRHRGGGWGGVSSGGLREGFVEGEPREMSLGMNSWNARGKGGEKPPLPSPLKWHYLCRRRQKEWFALFFFSFFFFTYKIKSERSQIALKIFKVRFCWF